MEKKAAKKMGAKLVPNSGRGFQKGDAKIPGFLIDFKFNAKSFTLSLINWKKHSKDAWKQGQNEAMINIQFEDGTSVVIIDYHTFNDMYEKAWKYEDLTK
jgi:hypothetical protein